MATGCCPLGTTLTLLLEHYLAYFKHFLCFFLLTVKESYIAYITAPLVGGSVRSVFDPYTPWFVVVFLDFCLLCCRERKRIKCILIILVKHCVAPLGRKLEFYIILFLQCVEGVEGEEDEELKADLCVFHFKIIFSNVDGGDEVSLLRERVEI